MKKQLFPCPNCNAQIEKDEDDLLSDFSCPSCGEQLSLFSQNFEEE